MRGILAWTGCVIVCIGTCLPRTTAEVSGTYQQGNATVSFRRSPVRISGLSARASVQGFSLPGWCVAVAAVVGAIITTVSPKSRFVPIGLAIYGAVHVLFMVLALASTPKMDPDVGIGVVLLGFALLYFSVFVNNSFTVRVYLLTALESFIKAFFHMA
jgi:hypothetical protein